MHDVTLVILNSLRIKCHIRRPLRSPGDFFGFYIKNVNKTNKNLFEQKNPTCVCRYACTVAHIPNIHCATFYHMLCIFYIHFGGFSMVTLALKCTKK